MPAKSVTKIDKKFAQDLQNGGFLGPPWLSKPVVRVPMGIRFSKFEALYLKSVMESDFGLQNYSKLQTTCDKIIENDPKNEARGSRIESKLK